MIYHNPVLVAEVISYMRLQPGDVYVDCTTGGGGHLLHMMKASPESRFIGIDWDPEAVAHARMSLDAYPGNWSVTEANFIDVGLILKNHNIEFVSGVLFDFGVSYHQVTTPSRGFSYDMDGPLLMRMSPTAPTLKRKMRSSTEYELAQVLRTYGDVRGYRKIAQLLFTQRGHLETTGDIRSIVEQVTPKRFHKKNCRRVFQALRIWVNDELTNLSTGLTEAFTYLKKGGRLVTIAYHSGEDRIVKRFLRACAAQGKATVLTRKVVKPSEGEVEINPQARSARLRAGEKCV